MKIRLWLSKNYVLVLIILLAVFLRFYKLEETFLVLPETGGDLMIAKNAIVSQSLPLHGSVSSRTWLYFGPYYWWILQIFSFLSGFNPISHAVLGRICSVLVVGMAYLLIKNIVNVRTALFSAFFICISPLFMLNARVGRHDSFSILLSLVFLYILSLSKDKKLIAPFIVGLILGLGINFEYTFLLIIPVLISFILIRRITISISILGKLVLGFLIPFLPLILFEIETGKPMLAKIFLWIPYRILGYFKIINSNVVDHEFADDAYSFWKLTSDSFFVNSNLLLTIIISIPIIFSIYILVKKLKQKAISAGELLLLLVTCWYLVGLLIHTNPPVHYFSEIFFIPIVLTCYAANYFWKKRIFRSLFIIFAIVLFMANMGHYFSDVWFYKNYDFDQSSYRGQVKVIKKIISDSNGRNYSFGRAGLFEDRPYNFADQYFYLLSFFGRKPVANAKIKYIIYDDERRYRVDAKNGKTIRVGEMKILKLTQ